MSIHALVQKLWNYATFSAMTVCFLRAITFEQFEKSCALKMADEQSRPPFQQPGARARRVRLCAMKPSSATAWVDST